MSHGDTLVPVDLPIAAMALPDTYLVSLAHSRQSMALEITDASAAAMLRLAATNARSYSDTVNAVLAKALETEASS